MMKTIVRLDQSELKIMIALMKLEHSEFENQELNVIAKQISQEFGVNCLVRDLEHFYSDEIIEEDFELESRRVENKYYQKLEEYEDRVGLREIS